MNNKATSTFAILTLVVTMIAGIYILSATFVPLQSASTTLSNQMGATIPNESLGIANSSGDGTFYTQYTPIEASTWTVYANGTASSSWVNSTVAVTLASGQVVVTATGTNPSTAGAAITMDYNVDSGIVGMKSLSGLPGVAVLLFVLLVVIGFIMMAVRE